MVQENMENFIKCFMIIIGFSYTGKVKIRKVEKNVKINSDYYQKYILTPIFKESFFETIFTALISLKTIPLNLLYFLKAFDAFAALIFKIQFTNLKENDMKIRLSDRQKHFLPVKYV